MSLHVNVVGHAALVPTDPSLPPHPAGHHRLICLTEPVGIQRLWNGLLCTDRISRIVLTVIRDALNASGVDLAQLDPKRIGAAFGTFYGSQRLNEEMTEILMQKGPRYIPANDFAIDTYNSPGGLWTIKDKIRGPSSTFLTMTGASDALSWATSQIVTGRADVMVVAGYDEVTPFLFDLLACAFARLQVEAVRVHESCACVVLTSSATTKQLRLTSTATICNHAGATSVVYEEAVRRSTQRVLRGMESQGLSRLYLGEQVDVIKQEAECDAVQELVYSHAVPVYRSENKDFHLAAAPLLSLINAMRFEKGEEERQYYLINASGFGQHVASFIAEV